MTDLTSQIVSVTPQISDFDRIADFILIELEGGTLTHDPVATRWGMTEAFDGEVPETFERAKELFRQGYWNPCRAKIRDDVGNGFHFEDLPFTAALLVVDTALVNNGPHAAIVRLQHWLENVEPDGRIGPLTLARARQVCGDADSRMRFVNHAFMDRREKTIQVYAGKDEGEMQGLLNRYLRAYGFALAYGS